MMSALLLLEDGTEFYGLSIGSTGTLAGEVVFNTSMTGYQEILTDPSYLRQIVTLTCPHIGNVGINLSDEESDRVYVQGLVIRDLSLLASNYRSEETLSDYLKRHHIVAIADIDTRKLTRILSEKGAQKGCIMASKRLDPQLALKEIRAFSGLKGLDLAKTVSVKTPYDWVEGTREWNRGTLSVKKQNGDTFHVVAYDYGIKRNMLRMLVDRGCRLTVVPAETSAQAVLLLKPDGVLLSNGPGDPEPCEYAITAIKTLLEVNIPLFGICLGHQLLALASGAKTTKMKFGHHGANHPVKDLETDLVMISTQNHSFSVDESSLPSCLLATHRSLFDGSLQGIRRIDKPAFSFQGHPEASPGPHDMALLFDRFIDLMQRHHEKYAPHHHL